MDAEMMKSLKTESLVKLIKANEFYARSLRRSHDHQGRFATPREDYFRMLRKTEREIKRLKEELARRSA